MILPNPVRGNDGLIPLGPLLIVVTGLRRESAILIHCGGMILVGGGDAAHLETGLTLNMVRASALISIGIAGALDPALRPGDWVVARTVLDGEATIPADPAWAGRILAAIPEARLGTFVGAPRIVATAEEKAALRRATGAVAVDLESGVVARVAARHGLPFAAARVISDGAGRTLPPAARVGMGRNGRVNLPAVLGSLAANPVQVPALLRTAWEAERAFRSLLRGHRRLGPGLRAPWLVRGDLGELPVHVP